MVLAAETERRWLGGSRHGHSRPRDGGMSACVPSRRVERQVLTSKPFSSVQFSSVHQEPTHSDIHDHETKRTFAPAASSMSTQSVLPYAPGNALSSTLRSSLCSYMQNQIHCSHTTFVSVSKFLNNNDVIVLGLDKICITRLISTVKAQKHHCKIKGDISKERHWKRRAHNTVL